eukprot:TRINITY_DN427_c0_g1_i2.p1 TRINITY_DN427_c0_g1~~TRINITY_DN427_c0_g1_i2.p1  ORF type:complete len:226 (-),score=35.61 TRINITY_DN427_c0_g1_i2:67-744(-)
MKNTDLIVSIWNWERLTFMCIVIASKFCDDISCSSFSFSQVSCGKINLEQMNDLERTILKILDYHLSITSDDYKTIYYDLKKIWSNLEVDFAGNIKNLPASEILNLNIPPHWLPFSIFSQMDSPSRVFKPIDTLLQPISSISENITNNVGSLDNHRNLSTSNLSVEFNSLTENVRKFRLNPTFTKNKNREKNQANNANNGLKRRNNTVKQQSIRKNQSLNNLHKN